jgi:Na+/proline symporter
MARVEAKVTASSYAAAASGLALFALGRYVFKNGVPDVVASWVYVAVPALITFTAGYLARHTPRTPAATVMLPVGRGNITVQPSQRAEDLPPPAPPP